MQFLLHPQTEQPGLYRRLSTQNLVNAMLQLDLSIVAPGNREHKLTGFPADGVVAESRQLVLIRQCLQ